jgi:hypothetical protein
MPRIQFQREALSQSLWDECLPMLVEHWREVSGHITDAPLSPNLDAYAQMQERGIIRVFTARENKREEYFAHSAGHLVGYALFTVTPSLHCAHVLEAQQDAIYLSPESRGHHGADFIDYCTDELFAEGVSVVYQFAPSVRDFGPVLERKGFEALGTLYAKQNALVTA